MTLLALEVASAGSAGEGLELVLHDQGVEEFEHGGLVVGVEGGEVGEVGELVAEKVLCGVQWSAVGVGDDEVVDADVEGLGDVHEGFQARGDPAVLIAADLAAVAADLLGEFVWDQPASARSVLSRSARNGLGMSWPPGSSREGHCAASITVMFASDGVVTCHLVHHMA